METRPGIWVNAKKACNLADHMEVTPTISTLKCLETHITNVILPPQDHSLKWRTPSLDFIFQEDNFPYLLRSGTPSKHQHVDDGTVLLGSPTLPPTFTSDYDLDYFVSVLIFVNHRLWCINALHRPMIQLSRCLQIGTATDDSDG